jgi:hypothetical protein
MKTTLVEALSSFNRYMNRPACRVQVYTWRMACDLFNADAVRCFRMLPAYRDAAAKVARREIAQIIKRKRALIKINLPKYDETKGHYAY